MKRFAFITCMFVLFFLPACGESVNSGMAGRSDSATVDTRASAPVVTITPAEARDLLAMDTRAVLLDVRTREEHEEARIPGSLLVPHDRIRDEASRLLPDTAATIITYCRSGRRSRMAADELQAMGYGSVRDLGGIKDWPYEVESGPARP